MSHETNKVLISQIAPRPPRRDISERFWAWLQEQIEKIKIELAGRHQLFHVHDVGISNIAVATEQLLHEETIDAGTFDFLSAGRIAFHIFGGFANNANSKTITVKINGTTVITRTIASANLAWDIKGEIYIRPSLSNIVVNGVVNITGLVPTMGRFGLSISPVTTDLTISFYCLAASGLANEITMTLFALESARVQQS